MSERPAQPRNIGATSLSLAVSYTVQCIDPTPNTHELQRRTLARTAGNWTHVVWRLAIKPAFKPAQDVRRVAWC